MKDFELFEPKTWLELQEYLFKEKDKKIDRFRTPYAYMGVSNAAFGLETSLHRLGRIPSKVEGTMVRNFQKYSPINTLIDDYNNFWNWLSLGQHHGLPTRLIDWTHSPNVALHFLTEDMGTYDVDGAIWMANYIELRDNLPEELKSPILSRGNYSFSSMELKEIIGNSIEELYEFSKRNSNAMVFFEPPSIDDRIINQFALFSFMLDPDSNPLDWLKNHPHALKKVIIPASLKWEIRDKLDQANITERIIYPGLEGISKWLKRWYSDKNKIGKL